MNFLLNRLAVGIAAALPLLAAHAAPGAYTPVTDERLRNPEPANWLQYRGNYGGWGYSPLDKINAGNDVAQVIGVQGTGHGRYG